MGSILLGDCIEGMAHLEPDSVDAIATDPPYGMGFRGAAWDKYKPAEYEAFSRDWATAALRVLKPGRWIAVFGGTRTYHRMASGVEEAGFVIKDQVLWLHAQGKPQSRTLLKPAHEPILLAVKKGPTSPLRVRERMIVNPGQPVRMPNNVIIDETVAADLDRQSGLLKSGSRRQGVRKSIGYQGGSSGDDSPAIVGSQGGASRYLFCARDRSKGRPKHLTVKPIALMRWLVGLLTAPSELVLDPFIGSGSTAIAAEECGCEWLGFEIDPDVRKAALARIARHNRQEIEFAFDS